EAGLPTLHDILTELRKPGRDPREARDLVRFNEAITEIGHLKEGMTLDGIVTNITHFGAFVDIGVHCDGLVHVSQLADRFVKDPGEVVQVGKPVQVWVVSVDVERMRISLSMRKQGDGKQGDEKQRDGKQRDGKSGEKPPAKAHAGQPGQKRRPDGPSRGKPSGNRVADGAGPGKNQGAAEARPKDLKSVLSAINQKFGR
ncbi:MAG: S1 RNA-binding domain-containing protein, partial [Deltaproteobacteria bacterium]|nr:S1 RNA-binding domain-containing protein [Deltaproteobacteria bacterium]